MDCICCKIISKEIPAKILYEDDKTISFLDAFPVAKGHTLVIPKEHHEKIQDLPSSVNQKLFSTVHKMIEKVDSLQGSTLVAVHTENKVVRKFLTCMYILSQEVLMTLQVQFIPCLLIKLN